MNKIEYISNLYMKYSRLLLEYEQKDILEAIDFYEKCKQKVAEGFYTNIDVEVSNEENEKIKKIISLQRKFEDEIKQYFIENDLSIIHVTDKSPQDLKNNRLYPSNLQANHYETERGDYFFATSNQIDGESLYLARNPKDGMIVQGDICIYGNDIFKTSYDSEGNRRLYLKNANYCYELSPEDFVPVTMLKMNKSGIPYFEFSEEWITDAPININNRFQVRNINKIQDVTSILKQHQVFTDVNGTGEAIDILRAKTRKEAEERFIQKIKSKKIRYINQMIGINVNPFFEYNNEIER